MCFEKAYNFTRKGILYKSDRFSNIFYDYSLKLIEWLLILSLYFQSSGNFWNLLNSLPDKSNHYVE